MANIGFREDLINEFKSDRHYLHDGEVIDAVVAFANTDGGDLYIGVEDDGEITGVQNEHKDVTRLAAFIANRTVPPPPFRYALNLSARMCLTSGFPYRGKHR